MPEIVHQSSFRIACATLVMAGSLASQGCFFGRGKKPPKPFVPPPVYAKDPVAPKPTTVELPPLAGNNPVVQAGVDDPAVGGLANLPAAPPKPAVVKPTPPVKPPATVVDVTPPTVISPPQPATIFSAAERQRMNQEIDQSLGKVRGALARAEGRNLSADLATLAKSARDFMLNAEQTRVQDLVTAVSLAKRAESFATDLVQRLP